MRMKPLQDDGNEHVSEPGPEAQCSRLEAAVQAAGMGFPIAVAGTAALR